jgi:hypothetical protein
MAWTIRLGGLPAAGFGDRDVLPVLRSDAADRLVGRGQKVTWPLALPVTGRRERAGRTAHARPVGGCRLAGQGTRETSNGGQGCRTRSTAATRAGADAEGRGGKAPGRDADWDGIAQELEAPGHPAAPEGTSRYLAHSSAQRSAPHSSMVPFFMQAPWTTSVIGVFAWILSSVRKAAARSL